MEETRMPVPSAPRPRQLDLARRHYTDVRVGVKLGSAVQYIVNLPAGGFSAGIEVYPDRMDLTEAQQTAVVLSAPAKGSTFVLRRADAGAYYGTFIDAEGLTYRGFLLGDTQAVLDWMRGIGAAQLSDGPAVLEQFSATLN
ncbi:hypothetical protein [Deinococcus soli (ex Cha et al. 2016)]|uniref:Uncharacterized protein n=2 Tax=Deinococcus soli (ex Cha et al. 2016) TaxID=1309411 RepID=A0ACC6KFP3_9DEIO|nr:hypothetical protein [Deinococcus soli (ex Cha et al. 2016)]MDR6218204.1 hypothetical protein [Deinococcus soli (ex Cha et al. 2016)]MDR6328944.1 hypothetical protein [Deinococcus soli (ex Cha et al. 2016)]MDR6751217.1 hypothetical protein [Deinococcus soli (ex Cha et al. 2016)]